MRIFKFANKCILTPEEMAEGERVGLIRDKQDQGYSTSRTYNNKTTGENNVTGARCEFAFCKMYDLEWTQVRRTGDYSVPDAIYMGVTWDSKGSQNWKDIKLYVSVAQYAKHPWDFYAKVMQGTDDEENVFWHIGCVSRAVVGSCEITYHDPTQPSHVVRYDQLICERMDDRSMLHLAELALPVGGYQIRSLDTGKLITPPA